MTRFAEGPAASPGFLLWHLLLDWQREVSAALKPLELTHVQFVLLACTWWLTEQGEAPNQLRLAERAGTDVTMTSQVLRRLEARELVVREVDPADARARTLRLTAGGKRLARRAVRVVERVDDRFFAADEAEVVDLLHRVTARRATAHRAAPAGRKPEASG